MTDEPRRVRTQVERDADDHAWHPADPDIHYGPDPALVKLAELMRQPAPLRRRWWHRYTRRTRDRR